MWDLHTLTFWVISRDFTQLTPKLSSLSKRGDYSDDERLPVNYYEPSEDESMEGIVAPYFLLSVSNGWKRSTKQRGGVYNLSRWRPNYDSRRHYRVGWARVDMC